MKNFTVRYPEEEFLPIIISIPHSGTFYPPALEQDYFKRFVKHPPDTDWFLEKLYSFAPEMGITLISSNISRYVIDLNRNPDGVSLYNDGRAESALIPEKTFKGENLFIEKGPQESQIEIRKEKYYWPYYREIEKIIEDFQRKFSRILFFDAHSIKHNVPAIQEEDFPDLILGDYNQTTSSLEIIKVALEEFEKCPFSFSHNRPFKGGHLTRYFGKPQNGVNALQLEMSQRIYMNEKDDEYEEVKASRVQEVLINFFDSMIDFLKKEP